MSETNVLIGYKCQDCQGGPFTKPLMSCEKCGSTNLTEVNLSGKGNIHTYTIVQAGYGDLKDKAPYCLAVVELDEGPKVITIVEDIDVTQVKIGDLVQVKYMNKEDLPIFTVR